MDFNKEALIKHKQLRGKISLELKDSLDTKDKLSTYYTPGVAAVSREVAAHPELARDYTWLNNVVAVISDGSAVLGLGNIGPYGALPVMEGKAMLFKHFGGLDAIPIVLNVHTADEIVEAVTAIAPSFGGINLEDIAAPICFEVEDRLKEILNIPVMHDDQHGTAVVVLAGLINSMKITGRKLKDCRIVVVGAGAAGTAIIKLINKYAGSEILVIDSKGIVSPDRKDLNHEKSKLLHSPLIVKVEVTKRSKVRRNYLTYMRQRTGKSARLAGRDFDSAAVNTIDEVIVEEVPADETEADTPQASAETPASEKA